VPERRRFSTTEGADRHGKKKSSEPDGFVSAIEFFRVNPSVPWFKSDLRVSVNIATGDVAGLAGLVLAAAPQRRALLGRNRSRA
jgi:hypothetical protein